MLGWSKCIIQLCPSGMHNIAKEDICTNDITGNDIYVGKSNKYTFCKINPGRKNIVCDHDNGSVLADLCRRVYID